MKKIVALCSSLFIICILSLFNFELASAKDMGDFISAKELKAKIDAKDKDLILIGVLHNKKRYIPGNNAGKPIDGTFEVWRPDYSGKDSKEAIAPAVTGFRKSKEEMEVLLSKAGATRDSEIVVYSADAMHDAVRVYWQIKLLGHDDVKILDGGVNAWLAAGYPDGDSVDLVDEKVKTNYKAKSYDVAKHNVTVQQLMAALDNPKEWVIIDTRSVKEQNGEKTGSSAGAYGTGGIKGSLDIEWKNALNKDHTLKSEAELKELYKDIKGRKVITFCQSGVRSAHTQAVLEEVLDMDDVYNYDGSWIELTYIASKASDGVVDKALKEKVKKHLSNWKDYEEPI